MEHDGSIYMANRSVQCLGSELSSFVPESGVCRLYKSVPFTEKRPQIPETGMKDGFEKIEHEFPFLSVGQSVGKKQNYLSGCFAVAENFPSVLDDPKKSCSIFPYNRIFRRLVVNGIGRFPFTV